MLVVAPPPDPMESLMGYVLRLTELNGYPTPTYITGDMKKRKYQGAMERLDATPLIEMAGISIQQAQRLSMRFPERDNAGTIAVCGQGVFAHYINIHSPKVCPLCLTSVGRCEAFWDLLFVGLCPIHRVALIESCKVCDRRLNWRRPAVCVCACGADLRLQVSKQTFHSETIELMGTLRSLLYQAPELALDPGLELVYGLGFERAIALIGDLCKAVGRERRASENTRAPRAFAEQIDVVANLLHAWPNNFRTFLSARFDHMASMPTTPSFRKQFGKLILIAGRAGGRFEKAFIEEVQRYAASFWPKMAIARPGKSLLIDDELFRWGGMADLISISGMHANTVRRLLKDKKFRTKYVATSRGGRKRVYSLDWAREAASLRSPSVGARAAAKQLGMTVQVLSKVRELGFYTKRHYGYGHTSVYAYTAADVDALESRIVDASIKGKAGKEGLVALENVLKSSRRKPDRKAEFVAAILNRSVLSWTLGSRRVGNIMVSEHAAAIFFHEQSR